METVESPPSRPDQSRRSRSGRIGHVVAIVVNVGLLFVARNLLDWDVLSFLTSAWNDVRPAITVALLVAIVVHAVQLGWTAEWIRISTDGLAAAASCWASIRLFQVFPFEFDPAGYRWDLVLRAGLIIAITGAGLAALVTPLRLLSISSTDGRD